MKENRAREGVDKTTCCEYSSRVVLSPIFFSPSSPLSFFYASYSTLPFPLHSPCLLPFVRASFLPSTSPHTHPLSVLSDLLSDVSTRLLLLLLLLQRPTHTKLTSNLFYTKQIVISSPIVFIHDFKYLL